MSPRSWRPRDKQADHEEFLMEELQGPASSISLTHEKTEAQNCPLLAPQNW